MRAYRLLPKPDSITVEAHEAPQPVAAAGQILVRMRAAGLNRGELLPTHGLAAPGAPKPAGMEGAGIVEAVGEGVTKFVPGAPVMGRCGGAFAEFALMDAREAMAKPEALSWEDAAAVPITYAVVHDMLVAQGRIAAGEWLLVAGIASGVGVAALQVAHLYGAKVIGTSGSGAKLDRLKALGLDLALCTRKPDFHDAVMKATGGRGANLTVNAVGGSVFAECVRASAYAGRIAFVGYVDGVLKAELDLDALHVKRLRIFGVSNKIRPAPERVAGIEACAKDLLPAFADGRLRPLVDRVFDFGQLAEAKAVMDSNAHVGKIVLRIAGG